MLCARCHFCGSLCEFRFGRLLSSSCLRNLFFDVALLVLKGIYHYWKLKNKIKKPKNNKNRGIKEMDAVWCVWTSLGTWGLSYLGSWTLELFGFGGQEAGYLFWAILEEYVLGCKQLNSGLNTSGLQLVANLKKCFSGHSK